MDFIQDEESAGQPSTAGREARPRAPRAPGVPRPGTPEQLEALRKLAEMLTRSLDLDEVLQQVRRAVIEVLGFDRCGVWVVDEEQGIVQGRWGTDRQGNLVDERHRRYDLRESWHGVGLVAQGRQSFSETLSWRSVPASRRPRCGGVCRRSRGWRAARPTS